MIKENLERKTDRNEEMEPSLAKFSATRWTVRAVCFKRILKNYQTLQVTSKECLVQSGLSTEIKAAIVGSQVQMNSFNYLVGVLLGERLFCHTCLCDNLSATSQKSNLSAVAGQNLAKQKVETLKRIQNDDSLNLFHDTVLEKKKSLPDFGELLENEPKLRK